MSRRRPTAAAALPRRPTAQTQPILVASCATCPMLSQGWHCTHPKAPAPMVQALRVADAKEERRRADFCPLELFPAVLLAAPAPDPAARAAEEAARRSRTPSWKSPPATRRAAESPGQ